jgi:hypothetical protein
MRRVVSSVGWMCLCAMAFLLCGGSLVEAAVVAWWRFEPGNLGADSSGNGHTLTVNGVTSGTPAPVNGGSGSAFFNGSHTTLSTAATLDLTGNEALTVEWFAYTNNTGTVIFWEHSANYNVNEGQIIAYGHAPPNKWEAAQSAPGVRHREQADLGPNGMWVHYAVTFDLSKVGAERIQMYVNGVPVGFVVDTGNMDMAFVDDFFFIGSRNNTEFKMDGMIDELRISDTLLTPQQFLLNAVLPEPTSLGLLMLTSGLLTRRRARR